MAEVLVEFAEPVLDEHGHGYTARACGSEMPDGLWQGWIEFLPSGAGEPVRSGRETTQPNQTDAVYWATGLTYIYLECALRRALKPPARPLPREIATPVFEEPAPRAEMAPGAVDSVLNPFSVIRKGEPLLRRQLGALSAWHLVNIIQDYGLSDVPREQLDATPPAELVERIIRSVRRQESLSSEG